MTDKLKEGGKKFDIFDTMQTAATDKTNVDFKKAFKNNNKISKDDIHDSLMIAGMTPGPTGMAADIADTALYLKDKDWKNALWSAIAIIPFLGIAATARRFKKGLGVLSDSRLLNGSTRESVINNILEKIGTTGNYKYLGTIDGKAGKYAASASGETIDISINRKNILEALNKKFPKKTEWELEEIMDAIITKNVNGKRPAKIVKIKNLDTGDEFFQPFYRSTGRGEPTINSAGKWLPFEGVLPEGLAVSIKKGPNQINKVIGKDGLFKHDFKPGEMPVGWVIKGYKQPFTGEIISSSVRGVVKEGTKSHQKIGNFLLSEYK